MQLRGNIRKTFKDFILVAMFTLSHACEKPQQASSLDPLITTWAEILSQPGSAESKAEKYRSCVLQLCKSGREYKAIDLIEKGFERGESRSILISAVFSSESVAFPEICLMASELGESDDRPAALSGIAEVIARMDGLAALSNEDLRKLGDGASAACGSGLAQRIGKAQEGKARIAAVVESIAVVRSLDSQGGLGQDFAKDTMSKLAAAAPFEAWDAWNAGGGAGGAPELLRVIEWEMAGVDPVRAMDAMMRDAAGTGTSGVYRRWKETAPEAAAEWLKRNAEAIPAEERKWIHAHDAKRALAEGELPRAWEAAGKLTDPGAKRKLEGEIWAKERNLLRKAAAEDPAGTLDAIVSGKSSFAPYWMEAAMVSWAQKDLPAAQEWYQQNWSGLPPEKAQFIAAAFAVLATDAGEFPAATQWVTHILDAKTRQRVTARIAAAKANKENSPAPK
jgi:hypothetical protein